MAATSGLGRSPLQAQHLLSLVLVVIHLSAVRQPLIPRLWEGTEMLSKSWDAQNKSAPGGKVVTHRDSRCCG